MNNTPLEKEFIKKFMYHDAGLEWNFNISYTEVCKWIESCLEDQRKEILDKLKKDLRTVVWIGHPEGHEKIMISIDKYLTSLEKEEK